MDEDKDNRRDSSFPRETCKVLFPFLESVSAACAIHERTAFIYHDRIVNLLSGEIQLQRKMYPSRVQLLWPARATYLQELLKKLFLR